MIENYHSCKDTIAQKGQKSKYAGRRSQFASRLGLRCRCAATDSKEIHCFGIPSARMGDEAEVPAAGCGSQNRPLTANGWFFPRRIGYSVSMI